MRAVIRRDNYRIEFSGSGEIWNDLLRPYLGGPPAPPEPVIESQSRQPAAAAVPVAPPAPVPVASPLSPSPGPVVRHVSGPAPVTSDAAPRPSPSQPRTWYPPRREAPQRFEPRHHAAPAAQTAVEEEDESVQVEPSTDPATLYQRLAAIPGRRSERDAVLAAVWFLTKGEREATADEVEAHLDSLHAFPDLKVVPHLLKHVHRTKMFEQGSSPKAVKLSPKGTASVRGRLVPV